MAYSRIFVRYFSKTTPLLRNNNLPVVSLRDGKIRGYQRQNIYDENFYAFMAIPYGKPPVGELRFKAPEPVEPWQGVKEATQEGDECYHRNTISSKSEGSENCLHLHVFTKHLPQESTKLKPVMVWIHGGIFIRGSNHTKIFGPEILLTEDVVLVSIAFRVGCLGYLHFKDPSLEVPGNAAFKDQVLALKWVRDNIKNFNGDPNNVTIFGSSSGAVSVQYHMMSHSSKGLFHKAIMQSGSALNPWVLSRYYAMDFAKYIDDNIKNESEALELFRKLPVEQFYTYQEQFFKARPDAMILLGGNVEVPNKSSFLTSHPVESLLKGDYVKVPLLMGYTNNEGMYAFNIPLLSHFIKPNDTPILDLFVHPYLRFKMDDPRRKIVKKKIKDFYFKQSDRNNQELWSDYLFNHGIIQSAKLHAKQSNKPVYLYKFSLGGRLNWMKKLLKLNLNNPDATHCDEIGYLFASSLFNKSEYQTEPEKTYIKRMVKLWTNFAKTGNPTPEGNDLGVDWKPVDHDLTFLNIGKELTIDKNPEAERMKLWEEIFETSDFTRGLVQKV